MSFVPPRTRMEASLPRLAAWEMACGSRAISLAQVSPQLPAFCTSTRSPEARSNPSSMEGYDSPACVPEVRLSPKQSTTPSFGAGAMALGTWQGRAATAFAASTASLAGVAAGAAAGTQRPAAGLRATHWLLLGAARLPVALPMWMAAPLTGVLGAARLPVALPTWMATPLTRARACKGGSIGTPSFASGRPHATAGRMIPPGGQGLRGLMTRQGPWVWSTSPCAGITARFKGEKVPMLIARP
mmetsp:Transcript_8379/g.18374  ORF Transcript_8379/g.18374 Transcript_8379/m.18374 type:complete len:243 (+) Transcript_8379:433-1161(+)